MLHRLALLALAPLLVAQGRRVRRTTPRLPEAPGDREGVTGAGPALRLLVVGDSAAAGAGARDARGALGAPAAAGGRGGDVDRRERRDVAPHAARVAGGRRGARAHA